MRKLWILTIGVVILFSAAAIQPSHAGFRGGMHVGKMHGGHAGKSMRFGKMHGMGMRHGSIGKGMRYGKMHGMGMRHGSLGSGMRFGKMHGMGTRHGSLGTGMRYGSMSKGIPHRGAMRYGHMGKGHGMQFGHKTGPKTYGSKPPHGHKPPYGHKPHHYAKHHPPHHKPGKHGGHKQTISNTATANASAFAEGSGSGSSGLEALAILPFVLLGSGQVVPHEEAPPEEVVVAHCPTPHVRKCIPPQKFIDK